MKFVLVLFVAVSVTASQWDPHLPYSSSTFFEGWYTRLLSADGTSSFGVIFGKTSNPKTKTDPLAMVTLLYQNLTCATCKLESYDVYPEPSSIDITASGAPVSKNPDFKSAPSWEWRAPEYGFYQTKKDTTVMHFKAGPITFDAELGGTRPWTDTGDGYGPAGILDRLPTPLHWFVHSLASPVASYKWENAVTGQIIKGSGGAAHQEKNWGDSFPSKWIWAEALDQKSGVALAMSGGDLSFSIGPVLPIELSHLIGYRSPGSNLSWDFTPVNSRLKKTIAACNGRFAFDVYHNVYPRRLSVVMSAEPSSFDTCILGPGVGGFKPMSVESFVTRVEIWAYQHRPIGTDKLLDHQVVINGGLEFGGLYRCLNPDACASPLK